MFFRRKPKIQLILLFPRGLSFVPTAIIRKKEEFKVERICIIIKTEHHCIIHVSKRN